MSGLIRKMNVGRWLMAGVMVCASGVAGARAQSSQPALAPERSDPVPPDLDDLAPVEKLNQSLPLDLTFTDEDGKQVRLADFFHKDRPVILNLQYFSCPMLCGLILNGLTEGMKGIAWTPGKEYEVLSVSFDARESFKLAKLKKQNYLKEFDRPGADAGWHFLVGSDSQVNALCDAVGYKFRWNDAQNQFAHASVIMLLTPDGKVSRYLYGVAFDPTTLRLSLVEASQGKIGSTSDRMLLYCFQYDAAERRYSVAARRLMSTAGALMILVMGVWLVPRWVRDWRQPGGGTNDPGQSEHGA